MRADGKGWLFVPAGLVDGPLPTHYEPHESPIQNPLYKQQTSPVHKVWAPGKPYNQLAAVGDPKFPYVISTYRLTEHYLAGAMSRWLPWLAELQPELFIEIGKGLAQEKGIRNLDWVRVSSPRGHIRAKALVTDRIGVMHVGGKLIHHVGMPWHWGWMGLSTGDVVNDLTAWVGDPNVSIHEGKAFVCNVEKAWYARAHGILHRHHGLHRVQSVRGRVQGMEPAAGRERRHPGAERRQLRQPPPAGRHPLAARPLHRAVQAPLRRPLADDERRVQALRPGAVPGSVPDRRHHPHRVRHGGDSVRCLQRMSRVHRRLPVRRHRHQSGLGHRAEVHALLRPAQGGARARVLEGVSHGLDPVRLDRRAADAGAEARRPAQVTGCQGRTVRRRPEGVARRAQFVLPAGGRTGGLRAAAQPATAEPQPRQERRLLGGERGRPWRLGPGRPAQAPDGRHGWAGSGGIELMSDTFFSGAPHWAWLIILYFFVGGIAGGACLLAAVVDWFGGPGDRPVVRTGYSVAAWGAILSGALLTIDLGRPLRFWHMLFQSANGPGLMFKGWSPISFGAWAILVFGLFAVLSALGGLAEEVRLGD